MARYQITVQKTEEFQVEVEAPTIQEARAIIEGQRGRFRFRPCGLGNGIVVATRNFRKPIRFVAGDGQRKD